MISRKIKEDKRKNTRIYGSANIQQLGERFHIFMRIDTKCNYTTLELHKCI